MIIYTHNKCTHPHIDSLSHTFPHPHHTYTHTHRSVSPLLSTLSSYTQTQRHTHHTTSNHVCQPTSPGYRGTERSLPAIFRQHDPPTVRGLLSTILCPVWLPTGDGGNSTDTRTHPHKQRRPQVLLPQQQGSDGPTAGLDRRAVPTVLCTVWVPTGRRATGLRCSSRRRGIWRRVWSIWQCGRWRRRWGRLWWV